MKYGSFVILALHCLIAWLAHAWSKQEASDPGTGSHLTAVKGTPFPSLIDVTIDDLQNGLQSELFTSVDLVKAYIARTLLANVTLNVITELNPDALQIAAALDAERAVGMTRGPLHGVPIFIKNTIATADKMNNTAGSYALLGATVPRDATVAAKLREAGAIILGKANMSQWSSFRSGNSNDGWSAHGGQVYGAYYPMQTPSGSSSGSGVATSLGLGFASLGAETDGSIVSPSQRNGVVGIKPTVGLTSRHLIIPISEHQDTVGPMARTVKDAAYILQAIAGPDPRDNYTSGIPNDGKIPDYVAACKLSAFRGTRIGVPRNLIQLGMNPDSAVEVLEFNTAVSTIRELGATVIENAKYAGIRGWSESDAERIVLGADFISNLATYLSELTFNPTGVRDIISLREFTRTFAAEMYPSRDTSRWDELIEKYGFNNTDPRFWTAYKEGVHLGGDGGHLGALQRFNLDAIVIPTKLANGFPAVVGSPVVTVPLGFYPPLHPVRFNKKGNLVATGPNIPFGISFLGRKWDEAKLIGMAYAFEQKTMTRNKVRPYFVPNIELGDIVGH
ncbi:amidase [Eremomyces bilateralis CBS 781.70]|uniref:Amidase n=1 Tax=Eremomyces bilateralis CBS 781.70 TaxID=1392243 RepID=A0A6G1FXF7_9PEZI|nr:amidase [Eremomyces bilateralis CBS 781.70]KAF1810361.1 amidase [Eremomyces bilateralis CBS 781.70]